MRRKSKECVIGSRRLIGININSIFSKRYNFINYKSESFDDNAASQHAQLEIGFKYCIIDFVLS